MTRWLEFVCDKDPVLARQYQHTFGAQFAAELAKNPDLAELRESWIEKMVAEAERQEHYDFVVDINGKREVTYGIVGPGRALTAILLVPSITVRGEPETERSCPTCKVRWVLPVGLVDVCPKCAKWRG